MYENCRDQRLAETSSVCSLGAKVQYPSIQSSWQLYRTLPQTMRIDCAKCRRLCMKMGKLFNVSEKQKY